MLKHLTFAATLLALSSFAFAQIKTPDRSQWSERDFWMELSMGFEAQIQGQLNNNLCYRDYAHFSGCMNGLAKGLTLAVNDGKLYSLRPSNETKLGYEIVGIRFKDIAEYKVQMKLYSDLLKHWYDEMTSNLVSARLDFEVAYQNFKSQYVNSSNEAYIAGKVYNAFLEKAVDPHTYIIPTKMKEEESKGSSNPGGQKGIYGLNFLPLNYLNQGEYKILVSSVYEGSSAQEAGIEAGDIITSINEKSDYESMVKEFKEESITVEVEGSSGRRTLTFSRKQIEVNTVSSDIFTSLDGRKIGYIHFKTFMDSKGCEKVTAAGIELIKKGAKALILDLRNNGGGLVHVATCINSQFLEKGSIIFVEKNLQSNQFKGKKNIVKDGAFRNTHTAVLVNAGSASASEVVSIYLQAYRKAFIVGENSFGKGTMQSVGKTNDPNILMASTIARYYGPQGISPQLQGVIPDIEAYPRYEQDGPSEANRERDLYDNAIANQVSEISAMPDRVEQIEQIKGCLEETGAPARSYEEKDEYKKRVHDNQKSVAIATLDCALKLKTPIFNSLEIPSNFQ